MPTLGNALDFSKYEARNVRAHQLGAAPSSPVTGQMYYNTGDNTLYWWDGTQWVSARGGAAATPPATSSSLGTVQLAGDLAGTATSPQIASGVIVDADVSASAAIAESKLNLATDAAAAVGSRRTLGSGATQAAAGNDARFTDARAPTGNAGGDLTGTYPNPTIGVGKVTTSHILDGTITDTDVAGANKDGANATPSLRTLSTTPKSASAGQAIAASTPLDRMSAPTAVLDMGIQRITNLADPSGNTDAANKQYVDNAVQGLDAKASVRVAYTTNQTLSGAAVAEGGITPANGERVLVMGQTSAPANGIYTVNTGGAWPRAGDADTWTELISAFVFVEQGSNQDNGYVCTVDTGGTLGTTNVTWTQFSGAGQIDPGWGLSKLGNQLNVGSGPGIQVLADTVSVAANGIDNSMLADGAVNLASADVTGTLPVSKGGTGVTTLPAGGIAGYYSSATHSAGATITITQATHGLRASRGLIVQCQIEATGAVVDADVSVAANGDVTVTFGASQTANTIRVTVLG